MVKNVLVIGATGDVGRGVTRACLDAGWRTLGAARNWKELETVRRALGGAEAGFHAVVGDLDSESGAIALANAAGVEQLDAVVNTVNTGWSPRPISDCSYADIEAHLGAYLRMHVNAARAIVPLLKDGAIYVAVGGGMADVAVPGLTAVSMAQAAQRMLMRGWSRELRSSPVAIRELMIQSHVNGESNRAVAEESWLTDAEIGRAVAAIIRRVEDFPETVLTISPSERSLA